MTSKPHRVGTLNTLRQLAHAWADYANYASTMQHHLATQTKLTQAMRIPITKHKQHATNTTATTHATNQQSKAITRAEKVDKPTRMGQPTTRGHR